MSELTEIVGPPPGSKDDMYSAQLRAINAGIRSLRHSIVIGFCVLAILIVAGLLVQVWVQSRGDSLAILQGRVDQQSKIGAEIIRELRHHADNPRMRPDTYGEE